MMYSVATTTTASDTNYYHAMISEKVRMRISSYCTL
jgi:hypothetical protein